METWRSLLLDQGTLHDLRRQRAGRVEVHVDRRRHPRADGHVGAVQSGGGAPGVRDSGALEAALFRPQTGYYADVVAEAAALFESIAVNHPFVDGSKRVAFAAVDVFLRINGWRLRREPMRIHRPGGIAGDAGELAGRDRAATCAVPRRRDPRRRAPARRAGRRSRTRPRCARSAARARGRGARASRRRRRSGRGAA